MNTRTAAVGHHSPWRAKYTARAPETRSSEIRSVVESRKAPAFVGPTPARATAPSRASQIAATASTSAAHTKWPARMIGAAPTCSSRPKMVSTSAVRPRRASTTPTLKKPRRAPSVYRVLRFATSAVALAHRYGARACNVARLEIGGEDVGRQQHEHAADRVDEEVVAGGDDGEEYQRRVREAAPAQPSLARQHENGERQEQRVGEMEAGHGREGVGEKTVLEDGRPFALQVADVGDAGGEDHARRRRGQQEVEQDRHEVHGEEPVAELRPAAAALREDPYHGAHDERQMQGAVRPDEEVHERRERADAALDPRLREDAHGFLEVHEEEAVGHGDGLSADDDGARDVVGRVAGEHDETLAHDVLAAAGGEREAGVVQEAAHGGLHAAVHGVEAHVR